MLAHASRCEMSLVLVRRIACDFPAAHVAPEESRGRRRTCPRLPNVPLKKLPNVPAAVETTHASRAGRRCIRGRSPRGRPTAPNRGDDHAAPSPGRRGGEPAGWCRRTYAGLAAACARARPASRRPLFSLESSSRTCPAASSTKAAAGARFCGDRCLCAPDRSRDFVVFEISKLYKTSHRIESLNACMKY